LNRMSDHRGKAAPTVLIVGAAGNLGSRLTQHLMGGPYGLKLLIHHTPLPFEVDGAPRVSVHRADLAEPATLYESCAGTDCIIHLAGVLFAPHPERFLPMTNVQYVENLARVAQEAGVRRFILVSFPHVEGETFPDRPARGSLDGNPSSVHARTRLAAERRLFEACGDAPDRTMTPVVLRAGTIYGRGLRLIEAARWLARRRMLAVWRQPTWTHLLALPDFLQAVVAAIDRPDVHGIYNLGDDQPLTLQACLDTLTEHWGYRRPWRLPQWCFGAAAWCSETGATVLRTHSPLTSDLVKIGAASHVCETTRMKQELLSELSYPTLRDGLKLV
jgi:nucleoside-diphosphate-sugar epimerase